MPPMIKVLNSTALAFHGALAFSYGDTVFQGRLKGCKIGHLHFLSTFGGACVIACDLWMI